MFDHMASLGPGLRIGLVALAGLGLLAGGVALAFGVPRGEAISREAVVPAIDREVPARVETATLALG